MNLTAALSHRSVHSRPLALAIVVLLLSTHALGQFDANRYLRNCQELERGGDFETARQSCLNALAADPGLAEAQLTLGRIELELGNLSAAESQLRQVQGRVASPEADLLLAQVLIRGKRFDEAQSVLSQDAARSSGNPTWAARQAFLNGELERLRGNFTTALEYFRKAVRAEPGNRTYRLRLATLLFEMGAAEETRAQIQSYLATPGSRADADMRSLLGRALWAQGDLINASRELEEALRLRSARESALQARDLRALSLVYYGMGEYRAGGLALREATRRGNPLESFFSGNLIWLLLLLLLLAVHLVGESRIGTTSTADATEGPKVWTPGQVYGVLSIALLVALPVAVLYGAVRYENLLALLTPVQDSDTRAVFFSAFSLMAVWGAWRRVSVNGWNPSAALLGDGERLPAGMLLGMVMLAATLAYRAYVPPGILRAEFFLDLAHLTPAVALAMALIPLAEIFFRPFAFPALEYRYGGGPAVLLTAGLSALLFATPPLLLLAFGLMLAVVYRRTRSGMITLAAQLTLHLGLLAAAFLLPWARSLFV